MLNGIVQITGEIGVGKTSFALGRPDVKPEDIAVFNFDVKPYPKLKYRHYGSYLHILQNIGTGKKPEIALVEAVLNDFAKIKGAKVVIFDSWEIFAKCWTIYFMDNADKFKKVIGGGQFAVMSKLGHAPKVEVSMLDKIITEFGVETIFVINHLQDEYDSPDGSDKGVKTGRKVPEASKRLEQKASARFWLKHNDKHRCPITVVMKDPGQHKYVPGKGIVAQRLFPDRLSPEALGDMAGKDVSIWDIVNHYNEKPVGARSLEKYEQATDDEFAMIAGTLTETQYQVWENNHKLSRILGASFDEGLIDKIKAFKDDGKTVMEIYNQVKDEHDVSYPKVKDVFDSV